MTTHARALLWALVALAAPAGLDAQRRPITIEPVTRVQHEPTRAGSRYDPVQKVWSTYDLNGRIEYTPATGKFLVSWTRQNGTRQTVMWEPHDRIAVVIAADVTFDAARGLYTYAYTVSNLRESAQKLESISLEGGMIEDHAGPDSEWVSWPRSDRDVVAERFSMAAGWHWAQTHGTRGIPPGETVSGFQLVSRSPPAVVRTVVRGRTPTIVFGVDDEEMPAELEEAMAEVNWHVPVGFTIGPAPDGPAGSAAAEMSQLQAFLAEAERQGWLGSAASASRVRTALAALRSSVTAGRTVEAETQVATLLQDLGNAHYEGLLSEGRALLEYRLSLLRAKLRAGQ